MVDITGPFEIVPGVPPKRHVRIYRPRRVPSHDRPVLLLFDGQNVFDDEPSFAGGWHAHRAVERLAKTVPPPIVIGIDHGNEHRISELSPFDFGRVHGSFDGFLDWIAGWLLPKLRREHRLTSDPRRTIIGGSSMGGLASLYAALKRPDVFGGTISMSPSLWVARGALLRFAAKRAPAPGSRIYLDAGGREGEGRMLAAAEKMALTLRASGRAEIMFRADPRGQHREIDWRRRLLPALRFQFGDSRRPR
ncbi:MAG: alpha/beta hydrolase [Polyangiaceae bacterium]|nr:alpha/beta hydrolase [Polyangiaceae bacterium]